MIDRVLAHCRAFPGNTYVFQTKNPARVIDFYLRMPNNFLLGTTIETNRHYPDVMGNAPTPEARADAMERMSNDCMGPVKVFITIEPILDFDLYQLLCWIAAIKPEFVNIGADSKGHGLVEPAGAKVRALLNALTRCDVSSARNTTLIDSSNDHYRPGTLRLFAQARWQRTARF